MNIHLQSGGGGGGGGDKFIRNVALNLILLGAYFVFESFGDGGGFFGGGGGGDSGRLPSLACAGMCMPVQPSCAPQPILCHPKPTVLIYDLSPTALGCSHWPG